MDDAKVRQITRGFKWTKRRQKAAVLLSQGFSQQATADEVGVSRSSVTRWCAVVEFASEVDRLTLLLGVATRAERLRMAMRVLRAKEDEAGTLETAKDALDWLEFVRKEVSGDDRLIAALFQNISVETER